MVVCPLIGNLDVLGSRDKICICESGNEKRFRELFPIKYGAWGLTIGVARYDN